MKCHGCDMDLKRFYFEYRLFDVIWGNNSSGGTTIRRREIFKIHFCVKCDEDVSLSWPIAERVPIICKPST